MDIDSLDRRELLHVLDAANIGYDDPEHGYSLSADASALRSVVYRAMEAGRVSEDDVADAIDPDIDPEYEERRRIVEEVSCRLPDGLTASEVADIMAGD